MRRLRVVVLVLALPASWTLRAQGQSFYSGVGVTGQLSLTRTVNLAQQAQSAAKATFLQSLKSFSTTQEQSKVIPLLHAAPLVIAHAPQGASPKTAGLARDAAVAGATAQIGRAHV